LEETREEKYHRREELVGKDVYDAKAKKVGTVVDIGYSKEGRTALIIRISTAGMVDKPLSDKELVLSHMSKGRFETLMFGRVSEIGDIILLKAELKTEAEQAPDSMLGKVTETVHTKPCPKCVRENEKLAKFCVECGYDFREEESSPNIERAVRIDDNLA
jgi:sporulation protein YlmC with PRC-barrel domain